MYQIKLIKIMKHKYSKIIKIKHKNQNFRALFQSKFLKILGLNSDFARTIKQLNHN